MDFQFNLPCTNADLLDTKGDNYYVKHVYRISEIPEKLKLCKQALMSTGDPFYLFDHFDTYFSVIENVSSDMTLSLMRSFDLLFITVDKLGKKLTPHLNTSDGSSSNDRNAYLNLTKMCMFLMTNIVKAIDQCALRAQQNNTQQKRRGRQVDSLEAFPDWDKKRFKFLVQLYNIMQLPLEKLWHPPLPEENFVVMLCDICYRTLEINFNQRIDKSVGDTIFQILGTAIKKYNHALTFPVRILQILRTSEHAALPIADGIHLLHEEFGITRIFSALINDIVDTLTMDSGDTVIARNFSRFLMELSEIDSKLMIPHLSVLGDELLNCDSHVLRNCILQIMGNAVVGELTSEELSDELKEARNEFLENLLTHINDVSAHVRAKVLQIWTNMKEENAIPLSYQPKVLCEVVERLEDKTSSVRKFAVLLIKSFLERNPFAAKLTLKELIKKHEEECKKMEELSEVLAEERKKAEKIEEQWSLVIPELFPFIEENLIQSTQTQVMEETQENYEDLVQRISCLLLEKKYKEAVALVRKADSVAGNSELRHTLKLEEQCAYYMALLKSYIFLANGCKDSNEELGTQIKTVQFLQDCIEFSNVIMKAVPKIQEMLLSRTNSDVFEAVDFFTTGYLFGIKGTECGMRQMLYLVWSADKEKREAVSKAYQKILFTTDETGRTHAIKVVRNLSKFIEDLDYGHYTAMECLVREWVQTDDIDAQIVQVLFERFTMKLEGTSSNESRQALQLLIMASSAKSSIAAANINIIESIGFGERAKYDPRLYTSCIEFQLNSINTNSVAKFYKRYEMDSQHVHKVTNFFQSFFFHPRTPDFDKLTIKTIEFIYHLCQTPDIICQNIIIGLLSKFKTFATKINEIRTTQLTQLSSDSVGDKTINSSQLSSVAQMPAFLLTRFVFTIGYVTMKEMIFLDIDVYNNMKYRQELTEEKKNAERKKDAFNAIKRKTANLNMSATESLKRLSGTAAEPQQEPDEDLVGATAEDSIAELINHICEDVLLYADDALLPKLFPYILEICKYPSKYKDASLQQAATLTLIRFMSVSAKFCESNMPFLMNILNLTKNIKIKCNIVVGLSDLTFRFPNIIEPWTGNFYATLHDSNDELRLTAVKMLSHLILHEMIRVKGQISDLAMCIVDPHNEIRSITQQFFKEIANKSNILYNVLPDIISKLSDTNHEIEEEKYHIIMRYILGLIQKDRQVESLVEKLCLRFRVTNEERQWRDIAYCLSLLNYNEKTVKKLIDNIHYYKDKVQVDEVYQSFKLIISNTSKMAKPELKTVITEFETRLNECLEANGSASESAGQGSDNDNVSDTQSNKNKRNKQSSKGGAGKLKTRSGKSNLVNKRRTRRGNVDSVSEEEQDDGDTSSDSANENFVTQNKKTRAATNKTSRTRPRSYSSSSSSTTEETHVHSKTKQKINKTNTFIEETSSSGDNLPQRKRARSQKKQPSTPI